MIKAKLHYLPLRLLLHEHGHGELLQTGATVGSVLAIHGIRPSNNYLKQESNRRFTPARIPKPLISGIRKCGPAAPLSLIIITLLPMTLWKLYRRNARFTCGDVLAERAGTTENVPSQPQTLAALAILFTCGGPSWCPVKDIQLGISGVKSLW